MAHEAATAFRKIWNTSAAVSHQVDEHPATVALLDVLRLERCKLAPAQGAAQKYRKNRAVPFSFGGPDLGLSEQVARLFPLGSLEAALALGREYSDQ